MAGRLSQPPPATQTRSVGSSLDLESRYTLYKGVVSDHIRTFLPGSQAGGDSKTPLQLTLEKCLPLLPNLQGVGLRDIENGSNEPWWPCNGSFRGTKALEAHLGFNPVFPLFSAQTLLFAQSTIGPIRERLIKSIVLSTLLSAIGSTQTQLESIQICCPMVVDNGLFLTPEEEAAVVPILRQLKHLFVSLYPPIDTEKDWKQICFSKENVDFFLRETKLWAHKGSRPGKGRCELLPFLSQVSSTPEQIS